jgi:hypothetical protein
MTKKFSFNERVDKCIAQFNYVEARANEQSERHGIPGQARAAEKIRGPRQKA